MKKSSSEANRLLWWTEGLGPPINPREAAQYHSGRFGEGYQRFLAAAPFNRYALADAKGWRLSADSTDKLDTAVQSLHPAHVIAEVKLITGGGRSATADVGRGLAGVALAK